MQKVSIKKFLIYKSHIFPSVRKPIRSVTQYLMHINPALNSLKSRKMSQLLDEQQKKKLKIQRDQVNESINNQLRRYYSKYILPFENCPDYYSLLFEYAKIKMEHFKNYYMRNMDKYHERDCGEGNEVNQKKEQQKDNLIKQKYQSRMKKSNINSSQQQHLQLTKPQQYQQHDQQEPFYLVKKDILKLSKFLTLKHSDDDPTKSTLSIPATQKQQKLVYKVYKHLYPSQKLIVYNRFNQLYKEFLMSSVYSQLLTKYLLDEHIYHIKPFIYTSPLDMYQAKHSDMTLKECELQLLKSVQKRDKNNVEFIKLLQQRKHQNQYIEKKFSIPQNQLFTQYRKQYYRSEKNNNFYDILKNY